MTREQQHNAAYARARAGEDCAAVVGVEVLGVGIPASIKDKEAYRNEVKMILDDLYWRARDYDDDAESLRPT
jgi:hypothetical protein